MNKVPNIILSKKEQHTFIRSPIISSRKFGDSFCSVPVYTLPINNLGGGVWVKLLLLVLVTIACSVLGYKLKSK